MQKIKLQKVLRCPYCHWLSEITLPTPEHIVCLQCQNAFEPGPDSVFSKTENTTTLCTHPDLQQAAGMAYCRDCGFTEW